MPKKADKKADVPKTRKRRARGGGRGRAGAGKKGSLVTNNINITQAGGSSSGGGGIPYGGGGLTNRPQYLNTTSLNQREKEADLDLTIISKKREQDLDVLKGSVLDHFTSHVPSSGHLFGSTTKILETPSSIRLSSPFTSPRATVYHEPTKKEIPSDFVEPKQEPKFSSQAPSTPLMERLYKMDDKQFYASNPWYTDLLSTKTKRESKPQPFHDLETANPSVADTQQFRNETDHITEPALAAQAVRGDFKIDSEQTGKWRDLIKKEMNKSHRPSRFNTEEEKKEVLIKAAALAKHNKATRESEQRKADAKRIEKTLGL